MTICFYFPFLRGRLSIRLPGGRGGGRLGHKSPNTSLTFQFTHENVISDKTKFACRNPGWKGATLRIQKTRLSSHLRHAPFPFLSIPLSLSLWKRYARQKKSVIKLRIPSCRDKYFSSSCFLRLLRFLRIFCSTQWMGNGQAWKNEGVLAEMEKKKHREGNEQMSDSSQEEWETVTLSANFALENQHPVHTIPS